MSADAVTTQAPVKTAVLFTHSRPAQTSPAVRAAVEAAAKRNCTVIAAPEEHSKLGDAAAGVERAADLPDRWAATGRSSRPFGPMPAPAFPCSA
jgi:hypothetical protein